MSTTTERLTRLLAETDAAGQLDATSTDALLTTYAALTHQMHAALSIDEGGTHERLREQRDLVRAEILKRTGDL